MDERQIKQMASGFGEVHEPKELEFPQAQLVKGDVRSLPFADESFDIEISNGVINLSPEKEKVLSSLSAGSLFQTFFVTKNPSVVDEESTGNLTVTL